MLRRSVLRLTIFGLIIGIFTVVGLVTYATVVEAHGVGGTSLAALLSAQRQSPALWSLDAAAVYAFLLSTLHYSSHVHTRIASDETTKLRHNHQAQLEAMIANAERFGEVNSAQSDRIVAQEEQITTQLAQIAAHEQNVTALCDRIAALESDLDLRTVQCMEQADRIAAQENQIDDQLQQIAVQTANVADLTAQIAVQTATIADLTAQVAALQTELDANRTAMEGEARRLTEQAFRALTDQVELNTRQLDTANRMLQYHQVELQQLQNELRAAHSGSGTPQGGASATRQIGSGNTAIPPGLDKKADGSTSNPRSSWQRKL